MYSRVDQDTFQYIGHTVRVCLTSGASSRSSEFLPVRTVDECNLDVIAVDLHLLILNRT